jgi:protein phosphatase
MGAHAAGELASKLAVETVPHTYYKLQHLASPTALRQAIREANERINAKGRNSIDFQGMGTTCTCMVLVPEGGYVAHVGDSRAYRLRGTRLEQLTFDHSLVWEMAAAGHMDEQSVPAFIPKNVITRSLGPHPAVNIDLEGPYDVVPGDSFLLCSDGLSGQVSDEEIGAVLASVAPQEAVHTLVDLANLRGGPDNISVIVARVNGEPPPNDVGKRTSESRRRRTNRRRRVHPGWWVAMVACGVLSAWSWFVAHWLLVFLGAAGFGAAAAIAAVERFGGRRDTIEMTHSGPYGNGPYRDFDCTPSRSMVDVLAGLAQQLRALPGQESWAADMDWSSIDDYHRRARKAVENNDFAAAVTHYCHAIRCTMQQLREHRATVTTQSQIVPETSDE